MPGRGVGAVLPPGRVPRPSASRTAYVTPPREDCTGAGSTVATSASYVASGTASSSADAGTPRCTSSTSVSSTWAASESAPVSVTVRIGWPEVTGRPSASTASTEDDEPLPPSRSPAWLCTLSGSWPSRAEASPAEVAPAGGGARETVPSMGERTVNAATDRRATSTAARVCTRWAEERAATASVRLPMPVASWRAAASARSRAARYCDCDTVSADSACCRAGPAGMRWAARRARAKARRAAASACAAPDRSTATPPEVPADAARASARSACRSRRRASGDSTRSSTCPARTCWPSRTRSSATEPSAGELTAADARAVTVAGASTTSTTVARPTFATCTPAPPSPLQPVTASVTTEATAATRTRCRAALTTSS